MPYSIETYAVKDDVESLEHDEMDVHQLSDEERYII